VAVVVACGGAGVAASGYENRGNKRKKKLFLHKTLSILFFLGHISHFKPPSRLS